MIPNKPRSIKSRPVDKLVDGRQDALRAMRCIAPPFGCGGPAVDFKDQRSLDEYWISGMCQKCQNTIWGKEER